jgi:hypothetical protein
MDPKYRDFITAKRDTAVVLLVVALCVLGGATVLASMMPNLGGRIVWYVIIALFAAGIAYTILADMKQALRDRATPPMVERCRLISIARAPRSGCEFWFLETPGGRRTLRNAMGYSGTQWRGRWLVLTYTYHSQLVIHAEPPEEEN